MRASDPIILALERPKRFPPLTVIFRDGDPVRILYNSHRRAQVRAAAKP